MKPLDILKVKDREGNLLEENRSEASDVIRADTAFVMTNLLRGVVQRGTGEAAASLNWPLAGKTGTVDDNTDAWFIGFDPDITVGVWTGLDEKKPHRQERNRRRRGAADLDGVHEGLHRQPPDKDAPPQFEAPGNIVFLPVNRQTGRARARRRRSHPGDVHLRHAAGRRSRHLMPRRSSYFRATVRGRSAQHACSRGQRRLARHCSS